MSMISFKMVAAFFLFIKRKQFPSILGDSDHENNVSHGNPKISGSELAMLTGIHTVCCSRMHYGLIMQRRLLLKNSKWEEWENLFLVCKCFI